MDHFLTSMDRLFAGVLLRTHQEPLPFSDDQAYVLLMCMLFAIGGIVAAQAVVLFVFYVLYFLLGVLGDFLSDVITPDKYKTVTKGDVNKIFNVASNSVSDLQTQVKMLVTRNAEYTRAMEELLAREVDRIEFEKKVMRWAEQR
ncbi:hypothetical protein BC629DRAFT_1439092 [Irpex lacteus]|nr:hypothetical protein BC629DRAFT_1439092 [Irpex lacteus]